MTRSLLILAVAIAADLATPQSSGCCASTDTPPVLFAFSHACGASSECNGGLQCLPTLPSTDAACADPDAGPLPDGGEGGDAGALPLTCTAACTSDADCRPYSQYVHAFCDPCPAPGAPRVCTHL
jgi:hypothetical protein